MLQGFCPVSLSLHSLHRDALFFLSLTVYTVIIENRDALFSLVLLSLHCLHRDALALLCPVVLPEGEGNG